MRFVVSAFQGRDIVMHPERASGGGALSMRAWKKKFLTSKFSYLLFSNSTHKTKIGIAKKVGDY